MINISNALFEALANSTNKKVSIYLVDKDAYHNEEKVMVATEVDARVVDEPQTSRAYRPDRNYAVDIFETKIVYIPVDTSGRYLFSKIRHGDIVEIDGDEYRIIDIYRGYDIIGNLTFLKLTVA